MSDYKESPLGFGPELFTFPYGEHVFVMVRPLEHDWSRYDGSTLSQGTEEWRPAMIRGHGRGQKVITMGCSYSSEMRDFEFGEQLPAYVKEEREDLSFKP